MKRRHGNKKGKAKKPKLASTNEVTSNVASLNTDDNSNNSGTDEFDNNIEEVDSGMDAETESKPPQPEIASQPEKPVNTDSIGRPFNSTFGKAVYTRVKVKIKTSKNLDSQRPSDAPSQNDTDINNINNNNSNNNNDNNNKPEGSEKSTVPNEKTEDSANSLSESNGTQKSVGIKIKSRGLGSLSMSPCNKTEMVKGDRLEKKDNESLIQESIYNEQELKTALEVIKKIMQMDAAVPFNAPVNPVALGIPDYFEVITTPMDFGTICGNLEKGEKYKNSEEVFKDVQYIWDNCYKYNNKSDYIVELMKRVKKTFIKYWTAVGLFNDQPQENNGSEGNPVKEPTPSSDGNTTPVDGDALNLSSKKFHGLKKHKEGCQCAICVMMRRRQEREEIARLMGGQTDGSYDSMGDDANKPEGISRGNSPFGEYASSNMENSPDADGDSGRKHQEIKLGHIRNFYTQPSEDIAVAEKREGSQELQLIHRSGDKNGPDPQIGTGGTVSDEIQKDVRDAIDQQWPKAPLNKNQRGKMLENLSYLKNPMLEELYGTLFAVNSQSFWNGPHSLVGRNQGSKRNSSFRSAISSLMK
ncbi:hypothetical protein CASFOL_030512 [Castilleja foliolosa]|uniref:Bromo domain-containing protein n=1 Tax=Castilleja foliolosa TaxID=1961234 RepID=A0ABD3C7A8_9LAMI